MKSGFRSNRILSALFLLGLFFPSSFAAAAEPSIAQQRTEIIEKAKSDLVGIKTKLDQKRQEQIKAGDKESARNTQLRLQAAMSLSNMLEAKSEAGGDIFKVELIRNYGPIINTQDFSGLSVREIMNYRTSGSELYNAGSIEEARIKTGSEKKDAQALEALEGRALYYASHQTYIVMHEGFTRGMGNVALALNDTFADLNPATPILEAGLGVKVSGAEIGKELSAAERVQAVGQAVIETVVDYKVDQIAKDAVKGISTQVGPGRVPGSAGKAKPPASNDRVIGQADLDDVNNLDDIMPFTGLDNFNVDLRTGRITTGKNPGGKISPEGQAAIEQGLKPKSPLGGDQKIDLQQGQGTAATAAVPAAPAPAGGTKVIGHVDLENVNDVMDMAGLTGLENFNIDLRTGRVTASDTPGGRISPEGQAAIEEGLKPKGPLGGDQKIEMGIQNQTTQIDAQGQTTIMNGVWGDANTDLKMPKPEKPGRKPKEGLKPFWDVFDLKPEKGKEVPPKAGLGSVRLDIVIFGPDGNPVPSELFIFPLPPEEPLLPEPASDPFGDCIGPDCAPAFGGASAPVGADLHAGGGPASPFGGEDPFLHDHHPSDH